MPPLQAHSADALIGLAVPLVAAGAGLGAAAWALHRRRHPAPSNQPRGMGQIFGRPEAAPQITFDDVAGIDEAKRDLAEVVSFLRDPERFRAVGAALPRGCLLVGPPGTGKTLLAKAVAGEAGVPFFSKPASEFVEVFVGVGAKRVRELFDKARRSAPCIVFIDEIDAVGQKRGNGADNNSERDQTINQILTEMDGFDSASNVVVIAATNRDDILDEALTRAGRFDRKVHVSRADERGREAILAVHARNKKLGPDVDLRAVAQMTPGFSGADLANLLNESAISTVRSDAPHISQKIIETAFKKVLMGPVRSVQRTDYERRLVAVHESGHALCAALQPLGKRVFGVSILPRGSSGGVTIFYPNEDLAHDTRDSRFAEIVVAVGGRVAEALALDAGRVTTGAVSDLQAATRLAKDYVGQFGFDAEVGLRAIRQVGAGPFAPAPCGPALADTVDRRVAHLLQLAEATARHILADNRDVLEASVAALLAREAEALAPRPAHPEGVPEDEGLTGAELLQVIRAALAARPDGDSGAAGAA